MGFRRMLLPAALTAAVLVACGKSDKGTETAAVDPAARAADSAAQAAKTGPQRLATVMIGKRLGPENRIAEPTFQFAPTDTVYVSAGIQGAPSRREHHRALAGTGGQDAGFVVHGHRGGGYRQQGVSPRTGEGVEAGNVHGDALFEWGLRRSEDVRGKEAIGTTA